MALQVLQQKTIRLDHFSNSVCDVSLIFLNFYYSTDHPANAEVLRHTLPFIFFTIAVCFKNFYTHFCFYTYEYSNRHRQSIQIDLELSTNQ